MAVCTEAQKFVVAVVQRILANILLVKVLTVIVFAESGGGVAVGLHDLGDVENVLRMTTLKRRLRIPPHLVHPCVPSSTRRTAHGSRNISLGKKDTASRDAIHVRRVNIRRVMLIRAEVCVALIVGDDDETINELISMVRKSVPKYIDGINSYKVGGVNSELDRQEFITKVHNLKSNFRNVGAKNFSQTLQIAEDSLRQENDEAIVWEAMVLIEKKPPFI